MQPLYHFYVFQKNAWVRGCYQTYRNIREVPLGVEDGSIKDSQMSSTAKSSASKGGLNGDYSWCSAILYSQSEWLQVDLGKTDMVTAIGTQGFFDWGWVEIYSMSHGVDEDPFVPMSSLGSKG